jgi:hypothetical protein
MMTKRIVSALMLCLILFSMFAITFNIQSAEAQDGEGSVHIPAGRNVKVNTPDGNIYLEFDLVVASGSMTANEPESYPQPPGGGGSDIAAVTSTASGPFWSVWDIKVTAKFLGHVKVGIFYGGTSSTPQLLQTDVYDSGNFVLGDVNQDGKVNWIDLWLITKALGSSPGSPRWNLACDLNGDGKINIKDLSIAFQNLGKTSDWIDITKNFNSGTHFIYGVTDHFSLFGVR